MFRFSGSILIHCSQAAAWERLIDFANVPQWEDGVLDVRQTSHGPAGIGATFATRRVYAGRESVVAGRITRWDEGEGATMAIHGGPLREGLVRYEVAAVGEGQARVTYTAEGSLQGALSLLTPLMAPIGRAQTQKNLARLKRLLETGAQDPVDR